MRYRACVAAALMTGCDVAMAQFETSSTTSSAVASGSLTTTIGNRSGTEGGPGIGTYPSIARDARVEDGVGTNSFQAGASLSLELEPMRVFLAATADGNLAGTEEVVRATANGDSQFEITFQLNQPMRWAISSATISTTGAATAFLSLRRGAPVVFSYTSSTGNVSGTLQAGQYTLSGRANVAMSWTGTDSFANAQVQAQFELTGVVAGGCTGDFNNDAVVDDGDFLVFVSGYNLLLCSDPGMTSGCPADLNGDGRVDDGDFPSFVTAYNALECP